MALGAVVILGFGWLLSQQNAEDAKFNKTLESFLDEYWKFYPTAATLAGYYKYNDRLEDFDESTIEKHLITLDKFNAEFVNKIGKDKLSPENLIDFDIVRDALDLDLLRLEKIAPQQLNPIYYNEIILNSVRSLLVKDFATIDARLKSAAERAKQLPGFMKQAKENLKTPPREYTEAAIKQFPAIIDFYKTEVPKLVEKGSAEARSKVQGELAKLIPALEDFQRYLQGDLLNKSTGNFRLSEAHQRMLQLTGQGVLMLNELGERAKADSINIRREMFKVCFSYYKIMDPKFDIEHPPANMSQEQLINTIVPHVMNKIKSAQPAKEEWFSKIKSTAEDIKAFIAKTKILEVPEETLAIEPMSTLNRNSLLVKLVSPNPYEPTGSYTALINPYPESLPADQAQAFMDEYNNYCLPVWTIQKIYPGSFFPTAFARKNATLIRKLYPNQALLSGWPLYAQDMFIYAGYNNYDLKMRLNELRLKLQTLIDFQVDVNVHEAGLTKEQAIRLMMITGFQTQAEAERKWNLIVLHPGKGAYAYIGYQEILDMEADYKRVKGDAFSQKEFLQKLLSYGALPLRTLKTKIAQ
jgi:hypothetical protein